MSEDLPRSLLHVHEKLHLENANEAETRLKLIDRILFEVLGWTHADVTIEQRVSEDGKTEFTDYIIRTGFASLVIEAKRVGTAEYEVPNKRKELLGRKLVSGSVGDAIIQARDYGRKLGIPFAVVTNGSQWIIFPASRTDLVTFEQSSAIIFPSITSALGDDHLEFRELLSRDSVIGGALDNELLGRKGDQQIERRLNQFFQTPFTRVVRSSLFHLIESEITTAFSEDIVSADRELFRKCYVDTPERLKYDKRIGMHLARRDNPTGLPMTRALSGQGRATLGDAIDRATRNVRPLALLILGSVGTGKTTFITHIRQVREANRFVPRPDAAYPHWIYIDCRKLSQSENPLDYIIGCVFEYIVADEFLSDYQRCIQHAYKTEIAALKKGPLSLLSFDEKEVARQVSEYLKTEYDAKKPFVEKIIGYAAKNVAVFLVVDNVDQFEASDFQARIFSDAIALAQRLGISLVLAMRDSTFVENRARPIFDAFDYDPIQVETPDVRAVLSKRFSLARELLGGKPTEFTAENGARVKLEDSGKIIDLIVESVLNTEVGNAISILSAGDIRLCLKMTRDFLRHGYTATGKAMDIYSRTGRYRLPEHEAIRAIMLGSKPVYAEESSHVANPFDAKLSMSSAQFLRIFILSALVNRFSQRRAKSMTGEEIRKAVLEVGFHPEITLKVLQDLVSFRCIFTVSHSSASFEASYIPSRLGGQLLRGMLPTFVFLENTMVDTFIDDDDVWNNLYHLTTEIYSERQTTKKVSLRVKRVRAFFDYLEKEYQKLQLEASRRGLPAEWRGNPFVDVRSQMETNAGRVEASAARNYGQ